MLKRGDYLKITVSNFDKSETAAGNLRFKGLTEVVFHVNKQISSNKCLYMTFLYSHSEVLLTFL